MNTTIPVSYKPGIRHIDRLNAANMREWLEGELREINHVLAGNRDDYPVQAIVNHHPYLSLQAQKRMENAIQRMILEWRDRPTDWPESAARALLSLAAELRVSSVKAPLQSLTKNKEAFARVGSLQAEGLRTIATLSVNNDRAFWAKLGQRYPDFAGMAFQVLARIAPEDALAFLGCLPQNEAAIGGVSRKLPGFVSQFNSEDRTRILSRISEILPTMPRKFSNVLRNALLEAGFIPPQKCAEAWNFQSVYGVVRMTGLHVRPGTAILGSYLADRKLA
jgi:hypothetical protein